MRKEKELSDFFASGELRALSLPRFASFQGNTADRRPKKTL